MSAQMLTKSIHYFLLSHEHHEHILQIDNIGRLSDNLIFAVS